MAQDNRAQRQEQVLRTAGFAAWLLGLLFLGLSVVGAIRWPHWVWTAPIACALLSLATTYRMRHTTSLRRPLALATLTLALLVAAGALANLAAGMSH
ncbi:hypothetical protein [Lentzea sp. NBRC 102530]|uniref:hypothetical protein n=1 Tax=Lentzea sp. NBRC 102530 TaxID=3032201 RepID=UPI0024A514B7|nr:hypothetical protein [Lentzea sp. NBRC 102530]GLY54625.1 hypothetical protein Lesp01_82800 [Lentzea sp. NBRC 102530]